MMNLGNTYKNVGEAVDFGWQRNANSFVKFFENMVGGNPMPSVVILRRDQGDPAKQGPISEKLVNDQSRPSHFFHTLVTPAESLPPTIAYTNLVPARPGADKPVDYTFVAKPDYPPQVSLQVTLDGTKATLTATPTDDNQVDRVEFFVDWTNVGTVTAAPYQVTVDLANLPADGTSLPRRKFAYIYARAFDGTQQVQGYEQRAYSQVVEVGPEVLAP
jgi:hypothetical protein